MTTLYDSGLKVKSARFGRGILRSLPTYRAPYTASDAAQWAAMSADLDNARLDRRYEEAAAVDRHERGLSY